MSRPRVENESEEETPWRGSGKRQRIDGDHDLPLLAIPPISFLPPSRKHRPGSVKRISLHNFVSYEDYSVFPGPTLNVIAGINGSGKSAIVDALCLGLGGTPKHLEEINPQSLKDFVNRESESGTGYVEVELAEEDGRHSTTFKRVLHRDRNQSKWYLNGKQCNEQRIQLEVKKHQIYLDSPCQLLPQHKVKSFARLSEVARLTDLQIALGKEQWIELHKELVSKQQRVTARQGELMASKDRLDRLRKENDKFKRDAERFRLRQSLMKEVDDMKMKLPWLQYAAKFGEHEALAKEKKEVQAEKEQHEQTLGPLKGTVERLRKERNQAEATHREETKKLKQSDRIHKSLNEKLSSFNEQIGDLRQQLESARADFEQSQADQEDCRRKIAAIEADLASLQAGIRNKVGDDFENQLKILRQRQCDGQRRQTNLEASLREKRAQQTSVQRQLKALGDQRERRKQEVFREIRDLNVPKVYDMLVQMKESGLFRGEWFGPIPLEIVVRDKQHAVYVEEQLPNWMHRAFVFADQSDRDKAEAEARRRRIEITSTHPSEIWSEVPRKANLNELRHLGIEHWLDEVIESSPAVMQSVRDNCQFHWVAVGSRTAVRNRSGIFALPGYPVRQLYTPGAKDSLVVSRYKQRDYSSRSAGLNSAARVIGKSVGEGPDSRELELLETKKAIEEALRQLQRESAELSAENKRVMAQLERLNSDLAIIRRYEGRLSRGKSKLVSLEENSMTREGLAQAERNIQRQIRDKVRKMTAGFSQLGGVFQEELSHSRAVDRSQLDLVMSKTALASAEVELRSLSSELTVVEERLEELKILIRRTSEEAKRIRAEAVRMTGAGIDANGNITPETEEMFNKYPESIEELEARIEDRRQNANAIYQNDPSVVQEYERRLLEIEEISNGWAAANVDLESLRGNVHELKEQWLAPLKEKVQQVSDKFGFLMARIGYAGEVVVAEQGCDFELYGIQIRVRFRDGGVFHHLMPNRQSGGEQSLAAFMYILALQSFTQAPFNLVDEINQGVDTEHERQMYATLSQCMGEGLSQYFYVSPHMRPKDLMGLSNEALKEVTFIVTHRPGVAGMGIV